MDNQGTGGFGPEQCTGGRIVATRLFVGAAFILVGLVFTFHTLGWIEVGSVGEWWPIIVVAVGLSRLVQPSTPQGRAWGLFLVLFFGYWLAHNLGLVHTHPWHLWPLILVYFGISMIWRAVGYRSVSEQAFPVSPPTPGQSGSPFDAPAPTADTPIAPGPAGQSASAASVPPSATSGLPPSATPGLPPTASSVVSALALLGGTQRRCVSRDFRGGDATAVMGGCTIDLREAAIANPPAILETFAWWGGIEIKVPPEWTVVTEGTAILGAYEDKTRHVPSRPDQTLIIRGVVVMGGVGVTN
jgi:hypothetical protein